MRLDLTALQQPPMEKMTQAESEAFIESVMEKSFAELGFEAHEHMGLLQEKQSNELSNELLAILNPKCRVHSMATLIDSLVMVLIMVEARAHGKEMWTESGMV